MEAVQPSHNSYPYDQRERLDTYLAAICISPNGDHYYRTVVRPNLLPEITPSELPSNVYWIGRTQKDTISQSRQAFADMLVWLVEMEDLQADDATACAELLDLPCFRTDADILPFKTPAPTTLHRTNPTDATGEVIHLEASRQNTRLVHDGEPATILAFPSRPPAHSATEIGEAEVVELFAVPTKGLAQVYDFTYPKSISAS